MRKIEQADPLLSRVEVCQLIGTSETSLHVWIKAGKFPGPNYRTPSKRPRWLRSVVLDAMRTVQS